MSKLTFTSVHITLSSWTCEGQDVGKPQFSGGGMDQYHLEFTFQQGIYAQSYSSK